MSVEEGADKKLVVLGVGATRDIVFRSLDKGADRVLETTVDDKTGKSVEVCVNCSVVTGSTEVRLSEDDESLVKLSDVVEEIREPSVRSPEVVTD